MWIGHSVIARAKTYLSAILVPASREAYPHWHKFRTKFSPVFQIVSLMPNAELRLWTSFPSKFCDLAPNFWSKSESHLLRESCRKRAFFAPEESVQGAISKKKLGTLRAVNDNRLTFREGNAEGFRGHSALRRDLILGLLSFQL